MTILHSYVERSNSLYMFVSYWVERFESSRRVRSDVSDVLKEVYGIRRYAIQVEHEAMPINDEQEGETKYYQCIVVA